MLSVILVICCDSIADLLECMRGEGGEGRGGREERGGEGGRRGEGGERGEGRGGGRREERGEGGERRGGREEGQLPVDTHTVQDV